MMNRVSDVMVDNLESVMRYSLCCMPCCTWCIEIRMLDANYGVLHTRVGFIWYTVDLNAKAGHNVYLIASKLHIVLLTHTHHPQSSSCLLHNQHRRDSHEHTFFLGNRLSISLHTGSGCKHLHAARSSFSVTNAQLHQQKSGACSNLAARCVRYAFCSTLTCGVMVRHDAFGPCHTLEQQPSKSKSFTLAVAPPQPPLPSIVCEHRSCSLCSLQPVRHRCHHGPEHAVLRSSPRRGHSNPGGCRPRGQLRS